MTRLILLLTILAGLALAAAALLRGLQSRRSGTPLPARQETAMPPAFRTLSYLVLFLLMLGVSTGVLGAA
ncbi:hypothetical protein [Pseudoroseicyclus aestuarii]|uniref:Uncharacterized protein n=1 Tax=Pseudoroseicyclus aestuarii TaxID=1795041 RepID=A0A318SN39_9RHOB|nr:hypothetical protein [Pseudoroseicyclus aestuarii]PYE81272.1 hypothetical protein DFP88_10762 [Pseudoroseicyclus aestuarii]